MTQPNRLSPDQLPDTMQLYDDYVPNILDGSYRFVVQQTVQFPATAGQPAGESYHYYRDQRFIISGPRYVLTQDEIQARFPPANGMGDYHTILPHVVLRKRALPWERPLFGDDTKNVRHPWLALLLFTQAELNALTSSSQNGRQPTPWEAITTPKALFSANGQSGKTLYPKLDKEGDEQDDATQVRVLDLPLPLFHKICPSKDDLRFLAHVRCVDPTNKVPLNMHAAGDFSVLVANRLPQQGTNVIYLVSLEGLSGMVDKTRPALGADHVRLVALDSWTFTNDAAGIHTFGELMQGLHVSTIAVHPPPGTKKSANVYEQNVQESLANAYIPLEYQRYHDRPLAGWYRGPFTPSPVHKISSSVKLFHRADAALVLDYSTGMYDVSYAAAWQLGRLQALAAPSAAQDLRRLIDDKHDAFQLAAAVESFLERNQTEMEAEWTAEGLEMRDYLSRIDDPHERVLILQELEDAGFPKDQLQKLKAAKGSSDAKNKPAGNDHEHEYKPRTGEDLYREMDKLVHFFAELVLLYAVPYEYLVPHVRLLPAESMRFFFIDNNWLDALIEGALSIVQDCKRDALAAATTRQELDTAVSQIVYQYRSHLQGLLEKITPQENPPGSYIDQVKTGFLLRSAVVSGWPGLEVNCYDQNGQKINLLRLDHIGDDLLLCIAPGQIQSVVIKEPGEGLRFGLDDNQSIMLRHWNKGKLGSPLGGNNLPGLLLRAGTAPGVLDINKLAGNLLKELNRREGTAKRKFGPAAFALQMLRSPEMQQIDINQHQAGDKRG
ncbi:MAG: hypothetical protein R3293_06295 [Candidatus Promineifilaceae bacterium]|nr:hypothetical protein [Candidatus Promineifilaceae bacterium]